MCSWISFNWILCSHCGQKEPKLLYNLSWCKPVTLLCHLHALINHFIRANKYFPITWPWCHPTWTDRKCFPMNIQKVRHQRPSCMSSRSCVSHGANTCCSQVSNQRLSGIFDSRVTNMLPVHSKSKLWIYIIFRRLFSYSFMTCVTRK